MAFRDRFGGCPDCGLPLTETSLQDVEGRRCEGCGGMWLAKGAASQLIARPDSQLELKQSDASTHRRCPSCGTQMRCASIAGVAVEFCPGEGIWFDRGELQRVLALADEPAWVRTLLLAARKASRGSR